MTESHDTSPESSAEAPAVTIDARGLLCPAPVIELAKAAAELKEGLIEVVADDPAAETDIPAWCRMRNARLVHRESQSNSTRYTILIGTQAHG